MKKRVHPNSLKNLKPQKPGDPSLNPAGRPVGLRSFKTVLSELLEKNVEIKENGQRYTATTQEVICMKLIKLAMRNDRHSIESIMDRLEGRPKQETDPDEQNKQEITLDELRKTYERIGELVAAVRQVGGGDSKKGSAE